MNIASLLPSSTEICYALGLGERLVGVSHECDFPASARQRPVLTRSSVDSKASSAEIDRQVRQQITQGLSLYQIEEERLRQLAPDLIVTQDTCQLCAVSFSLVEEATARLLGGRSTKIVSLSPVSLEDVLGDIERVGRAAGALGTAQSVVATVRKRLDALRAQTAALPRRRVLALEWVEPPMVIGHWSPELIRIAGGEPVLGHDKAPTQSREWDEIIASQPEVVILAPCGFEVEQTLRELENLRSHAAFQRLTKAADRVVVIDGNAFFNRPGPRLAETAELAALAIHPEVFQGVVDTKAPSMGEVPIHWLAT